MRKLSLITGSIFAASLFFASMAPAQERGQATQQRDQQQQQQATQQRDQQQQQQQARIRPAGDLTNFSVQNRQGEELGQVSELLVDVEQGRVGYVIVSANGILGVGADRHIVPWQALQPDPQREVLLIDMEADRFRQSPTGDAETVATQEQGRTVHEFYGVSPYWEEGAMQQPGQMQQQQQREQMQQRDQMHQQQRTPGAQQQSPGTGQDRQ